MVKRTRSNDLTIEGSSAPETGGQKRRQRLEWELTQLGATEARRTDQLRKIQERAATVRRKLAALQARPAGSPRPGSEPSLRGPTGYCMREQRRVTISDPTARTLANGRAGLVGACASCGARVTVLAAAPVSTGG